MFEHVFQDAVAFFFPNTQLELCFHEWLIQVVGSISLKSDWLNLIYEEQLLAVSYNTPALFINSN